MIKYYRCPKCQNNFSQQDFNLHYKYCKGFHIPVPTTQINNQIKTQTVPKYTPYTTTYSNIPNQNIINYSSLPQTQTQSYIPSTQTHTQSYIPSDNINIGRSFRPQTAIYTNQFDNQRRPNIKNASNSPYYNYNNNYGYNTQIPTDSFFVCNFCGEKIPLANKKDHLLCHKIEQEDKDLMQAQKLQDDYIFDNVSPEQVAQQLKIEQNIKREQQQRRNNNNSGNNNNFFTNDFNINSDFGNFDNMNNMNTISNMNGMPNIIIRRFTSNGNSPNIGDNMGNMGNQEFFSNFFNPGFNSNNPSGMRTMMIPMSLFGNNMGGQNDLNEMIERMLHYSRENPTDAAIVSELPETQIDDIKKLDKDKQNCVICMEDFKNGDKSTNLPCLHMFHTNCIQSWLKTQNTCPICKFKLTQDNINNINRRGAS